MVIAGIIIWLLLSAIIVIFNYGAHMNDDETEEFEIGKEDKDDRFY